MHFILNNSIPTAAAIITGILVLESAQGTIKASAADQSLQVQTPTTASPTDPSLPDEPPISVSAPNESLQIEPSPQWILVTAFSYSFFNHNYDNWHKESVELYRYLPQIKTLLGGSVELEERSASQTDTVYGLNARWYANQLFQLHGGIKLTDNADFMPGERYTLGVQYQLNPDLALLFDMEHLEFNDQIAAWNDGITQVRPGFTWTINEHNRVTLSYTHGWVHDDKDFDYYSATYHLDDLVRDGTLSVSLAYGSDPDFSFGTDTTTLSDAYIVSLFYKEPIHPDLKLFIGIEYVYRMRPDSKDELYQIWTPTLGISWNF